MADGGLYKANNTIWSRGNVKKAINNGSGWSDGMVKHSNGSAWFRNYPMIQEVTRTWTNTASHTFSYQYNKWQDPDYDVLQGKYNEWGPYRGLWFFGNAVRDSVNGKTIKKIRVYVTRATTSGLSTSVPIYLQPHGHASKPAGEPSTMQNVIVSSTSLVRGQSAWVDVTDKFRPYFENGTAYGIGIYTTNTANSQYARMTTSAKIEITYDDYV